MSALSEAAFCDWIFATSLTPDAPGAHAYAGFNAGWEAAVQHAVEHRAVYYTGNQKDGLEPHSFADLLKGEW